MKRIFGICIISIALLAISCSTGIKFPPSYKVPAANITLKIKPLESGNQEIYIKAEYLAAPERLNPKRNVYVVWAATMNEGIRNLGIIDNENAETVKFETLTPFKLSEIFITAEDIGSIGQPAGEEVARIDVKGIK
ncbi:MAG TPA: hypothetical protein PLE30_03795 [Candidatus Kapabacteria bacterium]|nr:hypothetical protein [Candidatus Kapabacteria bacterium]